MNKWAMNLSKHSYHQFIQKKNFVNDVMTYMVTSIELPNNRVMVNMVIDVFGLVPTTTAIKQYLGYDISIIDSDQIKTDNRLQLLGIGETIYTSYLWYPNLADYSLAKLHNPKSISDYFKHILKYIPENEYLLLAQKLDPRDQGVTLDYDLQNHDFSLLVKGLLDVIDSHPKNITGVLKRKIALFLRVNVEIENVLGNMSETPGLKL